MKKCNACKTNKPIIEFGKKLGGKDGLNAVCKPCTNSRAKIYRDTHPIECAARIKAWSLVNKERVRAKQKEWIKLNPDKIALRDKKRYDANPKKYNEMSNKWKAKNPERCKQGTLAWRNANPEKVKATNAARIVRYSLNPEKVFMARQRAILWAKENPAKRAAQTRLRQARKIHATPKWACLWAMGEIYDLARLRTKMTGFLWHVDHIVPLKGDIVCGFHVENNLQVIPAIANMKKSNKLYASDSAFNGQGKK